MKNYFFIGLLFISIACTKSNPEPVKDNCKILSATLSSTKKLTFNYSGDLISTVNYFISDVEYNARLSRNTKGQLIKSEWFYEESLVLSEDYSYTGDHITRVDYMYDSGDTGFNRIEYNANGEMTKFTYEGDGEPTYPYVIFEYNSDGSLIKTEEIGADGSILLRKIVKPSAILTSPEKLIKNAGLPYDLFYGLPFKTVLGGDGTVVETYYSNSDGELELYTTGTVSQSKINSRNYLESYIVTVTGGSNFTNSTIYVLDGCE